VIKWCAANNNLVLNLDKMNTMKFITKNLAHSTLLLGDKSVADPMRNVSLMLLPGRTELVTLVKILGQAAHTLNNPQAECIGVLLCKSIE